jgi:long-chain acyl-CoA synthetase
MTDSATVNSGRGIGNVAELVRAAAGTHGDRPALIGPEATVTWAELDAEVDALARGLRAADLRLGDRVGLLLRSAAHFVPVYLAVLRAGLIAVPLDPNSAAPEIGAALVDTDARMLVTDALDGSGAAEGARQAGELGLGVRLVVIDEPDGRTALRAFDAAAELPVAPGGEAIALLLETAGTGGRPKRAMLSHRALLANVEQCAALDPPPVTSEDTVLLVLPLFGVFGVCAVLGQALRAGATLVHAEYPDPAAALALIAATGVTSVAGTPAMFAAWAERPEARDCLAGVRVLVSGSAPLRADAAAAFEARTGKTLGQGYGLTEAAGVVAAAPIGGTPGSVGKPIPGIEVRLLDGGAEVDEGDPGELWIRGENLFSGYWPDGHGAPGPDGWFATGDLGWADARGDLFMVSTRSDVIVVSGFPVYPGEVEDVLSTHPEVREAAVVAVPDERSGSAVKALIVAEPGAVLDPEDVRAWCASRLGRFKVPRQVEFVDELPRSAVGALARGRLRPEDPRS